MLPRESCSWRSSPRRAPSSKGPFPAAGPGKGEPGVTTDTSSNEPSSKKSKKSTKASGDEETGETAVETGETGTQVGTQVGAETGTGTGTGTPPPPPPPPPVTWSTVYSRYFAATNSLGGCGAAGCHATSQGRFKCGTTAAECFAGLVAAKLIDPANPSASKLVDVDRSPLVWFGGSMPPKGATNQTATDEIKAWVAAGALED